jgi:hypothetical protein
MPETPCWPPTGGAFYTYGRRYSTDSTADVRGIGRRAIAMIRCTDIGTSAHLNRGRAGLLVDYG